MTTPLPSSSTAVAEHWEPKFPFDLVLAYEDLATRNQAMRLHDQLARQLQDDYDLRCTWWKFNHLTEPGLCEQAADDAAQADMVILSVHAADGLPEPAQDWIEDWAPRREHHTSALVALVAGVEGRRDETQHLMAQLQQVARRARMDFIPHLDAGESPAAHRQPCGLAERARAVTPTLLEILQQRTPAPRGGVHQP